VPASANWHARVEIPAAVPGGPARTCGPHGSSAQIPPMRSACSAPPPPLRESTPGSAAPCDCRTAAPAVHVRGCLRFAPRRFPASFQQATAPARSPQEEARMNLRLSRWPVPSSLGFAMKMHYARQGDYRRCSAPTSTVSAARADQLCRFRFRLGSHNVAGIIAA
jgi:hypothetical protein